ncbi:MAG: hypothetical protein JXB46_05425, partial [Candidatus Eisenbacteria bacterium]|nr:hypothetical protein [Candidatus Eisenbacteria bacterium]
MLASQDQGRFPVVILADVERLDLAGAEWLRIHIENGGGVLLVLGNRTDIRFWNSELLPELTGAEAVRPIQRADGVRLAPAGPGHPILEGLVFGERLIDDIYVRRAIELGSVSAEEVLELPGIGPALLFHREGESGEVACLTIGVDPSWSDLPRSGFVVPLFHRVVARLADVGSKRSSVLVGEDVVVRLPPDQMGLIEVTGPDGSVTTAEAAYSGPAAAALRGARLPGIYSFRSGERLVAMGSVNIDPIESDLASAGDNEIMAAVAPLNCLFVDPGADVAEAVLQARHGRELWRAFLYAALLLVAIEMILARQRYV